METINSCVEKFFDELILDVDQDGAHHYKIYLEQAVNSFLRSDTINSAMELNKNDEISSKTAVDMTKDTAYKVYDLFLKCYGYESK